MPADEPPARHTAVPVLLADIDFGQRGGSAGLILGGWGAQEDGHRWSVGAQSSVRLPVPALDADCVVAVDIIPWCDAASLPFQTVMLAIDDRLVATFEIGDHRVLAFPIPAGVGVRPDPILSFTHLNVAAPRSAASLAHCGAPLGLMVTSIRVFRLPPCLPTVTRPRLPGALSDGTLQRAAQDLTGLSTAQLASVSESLGHNCEFGLVQRALGAEPLGLLRFANLVTHKLVDGLMARFEGVGQPATTTIYVSEPPAPEYKVHEQLYYLWYGIGQRPDSTKEAVQREQCRRLVFLQRKFVEDLRAGERLFVLTRAEPLTEPEALAVFCALQVEGPNTLLWTTHGDFGRTGEVDRLRPGFLQGHLGELYEHNYASIDAWLSVLANAHSLTAGMASHPLNESVQTA